AGPLDGSLPSDCTNSGHGRKWIKGSNVKGAARPRQGQSSGVPRPAGSEGRFYRNAILCGLTWTQRNAPLAGRSGGLGGPPVAARSLLATWVLGWSLSTRGGALDCPLSPFAQPSVNPR